MGSRDIRFGLVAVQKGFVTLQQVVDALRLQSSVGQILLEQGFMEQSQIINVLLSLDKMRKE
jgi:hypothetical protein